MRRAGVSRRRYVSFGALALACIALHACGKPARAPATAPPIPAPVAVTATLTVAPLDLSPDGELRVLVRVHYADAAGARVDIPPGGHVDVGTSRGEVQWQPRARYGGPAAIIRLTQAGPLRVHVTSDLPHVPRTMNAPADTRSWRFASATAQALGPHVVTIGWFPRLRSGTVHIARTDANGPRIRLPDVAAPASTLEDQSVVPGRRYVYEITRPAMHRSAIAVDVPPEITPSTLAAVRGKSIWLAFDDVRAWNVDAMLARAESAGLRAIFLRLSYGEYAQISASNRTKVDAFIDGAARRGIAIVGWTVPRAVSYEDVAANVAAATYRTAAGHGISGLAVDLERGGDFLGNERPATMLATYIRRLRTAVGPHVLLVATVEDAHLERLPDDAILYAQIAQSADVLQPMAYWRMRGAGASSDGMQRELTASFATLRRLAGPSIPISIGGQSTNLGNRYGAPPPQEVALSFARAQALGAIGETLYDWDGTSDAQWAAIGRAAWPLSPAVKECARTTAKREHIVGELRRKGYLWPKRLRSSRGSPVKTVRISPSCCSPKVIALSA